jgi:hypothetical protein
VWALRAARLLLGRRGFSVDGLPSKKKMSVIFGLFPAGHPSPVANY